MAKTKKASRKTPGKATKKTGSKKAKATRKGTSKAKKVGTKGTKGKFAPANMKRGGKTANAIVKARGWKLAKGESARFSSTKGSKKIQFVKGGKATGQSLKR